MTNRVMLLYYGHMSGHLMLPVCSTYACLVSSIFKSSSSSSSEPAPKNIYPLSLFSLHHLPSMSLEDSLRTKSGAEMSAGLPSKHRASKPTTTVSSPPFPSPGQNIIHLSIYDKQVMLLYSKHISYITFVSYIRHTTVFLIIQTAVHTVNI